MTRHRKQCGIEIQRPPSPALPLDSPEAAPHSHRLEFAIDGPRYTRMKERSSRLRIHEIRILLDRRLESARGQSLRLDFQVVAADDPVISNKAFGLLDIEADVFECVGAINVNQIAALARQFRQDLARLAFKHFHDVGESTAADIVLEEALNHT